MPDYVRVASVDEIPKGTGKAVEVNGRQVALFNVNGEFHALEGLCPHQGGLLGEGYLKGTVVTCPLHFWQFDVVTGQAPDLPEAGIGKLGVKIEDGQVLVEA